MIKVKVNNEYKDVVKIFCGGTLQKEIIKVWSREAQEYVYESSVEYTGSLPITINANGDVLIDYRIYGASGGVGEPTENLIDASKPDVSQRVEVEPGKEYCLSKYEQRGALGKPVCSVYDEDDNLLISDYIAIWMAVNFTIPANGKYALITFGTNYTGLVSFAKGTSPNTATPYPENYIPYGYKLPMTVMDNLAPPLSQWVEGYITVGGTIAQPTGTNREKSSDFIEVDPNTEYVFSIEGDTFPQGTNGAWVGIGLYSDDWTFIYRHASDKNSPYTFSTSSNTKYVRLSYRTFGESLEPRLSEFSFSIPVYIGENQLGTDEYVNYGEQKIYKRTENLFKLLDDMKDAKNWKLKMAIHEAYFIYYHLSPEQLTYLKNVGTVYGKAFKKEGGQYIKGTVLAITNKELGTGVDGYMRLIFNDGAINNYIHDFTQDVDAYLCIGYGPGITEETKQFFVDAILNNFDIMLSSTVPTSYIPYVTPTDPPVPLPEIPTIEGTTIIDYDGTPKPSQMYVKYRR